ncbi:2-C-methyl-D-erythritol 2,4-cyclodiphosphate synthase [Candidatus Riesia pediculicola]|uniref:2-C-methyl-D-erythritol 2,4-cyclodiphosphate synthase n=1 Tax=Candidatus Riesia pediculicola TaxID=401619 RepID=UPI0009C27B4A|nr:2-C-methyl-D-erythritol 2,4-cyclodiphosphate synthase [Candidatus Riesia pediculicola]ARC54061.1 2-C-methyl-D-erythritol 2,4-cyclodiphosphate synthase [Candidatus Riesia pediculicola]
MRIGHGFDIHGFIGCGPIILGGVSIPFYKGISSHSDGDVLIHSLIDSILGAASLGDIGTYFPDNDLKFRKIDSRILLRKIWKKIEKKYKIGNIDTTIVTDFPKIINYTDMMKKNISSDLSCSIRDVNIKSTTTENLGFFKKDKGIACEAVVLLRKIVSFHSS